MTTDSLNRVTAGIPSLSPDKREGRDHFWIQNDKTKAAAKEARDNFNAATESDNGADVTNAAQQMGMPLSGYQIATRLKQCNPSLWFEVSNADSTKMGAYYMHPLHGKRFICGFERELNPEYEVRITDKETGECTGTLRGWRSVLGKMIRGRFITEARAMVLFGPPSRDSRNWQRMVS